MALAMVLTMASFPAFAEGEPVKIESSEITVSHSGWDQLTSKASNMFDDVRTDDNAAYSTWKSPGSYSTITLSFKNPVDISTVTVYWGGGWGTCGAPAEVELYVGGKDAAAADQELIATVPGETAQRRTDTYDFSQYEITTQEVYVLRFRAKFPEGKNYMAVREIEVYGNVNLEDKTPATYTVKYQSSDANFPETADKVVTEGVYVGDTVTEEAPAIDGYKPDAATKDLTLGDGTNEIIFTYAPAESAGYTVKYVDEAENEIATAKKVTGVYEGDEITENSVAVSGYFVPETSKTVTLAAGENEIVFTYTKIIKPTSSATANYINHTPANYNNATWPLTDGKPVAFSNGIYYFNGNQGQTAPIFELVFSFDKVYAFDAMTAYWSNNDTKVDVYVSDSTENWGDPVYSGTTPQTATAAAAATVKTPLKVSEVDLGGAEGQYIKVVFNKGMDSQIYEIIFEGGEPAAEPETPSFAENVIVNGAQIRLPDDGVNAGIRFGATLSPELVDDVNNFAFDPTGDIKVGMFIIPVDLLGGMKFEEYLVANDYEGKALKVVAEHIYERDETEGITYTAVLTEIPASEYEREITAVPYVCVNGEYQFAAEATPKSYKGVAQAIYADHEAGKITLSQNQLDILAGIIG